MKHVAFSAGFRSLLFFAAGLALMGCAHPHVTDEGGSHEVSGAPRMIYIRNFDIGATTLKQDPGTITGRPRLLNFRDKDPATELERLSDLMANTIVDDLKKANLRATRIAETAKRPAGGWIVSGQLLEVLEGNRMQNAVIGFGAGNAETKLFVTVHEASKLPGQDVLDFNVDAKGNILPSGAGSVAVTHVPYAMAAKFVLNRDASEKEANKAAHEVADQLIKLARGHAADSQ
jgi:hypothetical protein